MNKKTKKLLVSLLSVLMVLSFMPTIAFAKTSESYDTNHNWEVNEELSFNATCVSPGITFWTCEGQDLDAKGNPISFDGTKYYTNGTITPEYDAYLDTVEDTLECSAVAFNITKATGTHHRKDHPTQFSKVDFISRMAEENDWTEDEVDAAYDALLDVCYVFAYECKDCGLLAPGSNPEVQWVELVPHEPENGTKPCAETYKCKHCGEIIEREAGTEGNATHYAPHTYGNWTTVAEHVCPKTYHEGNATDGLNVKVRTCEKCEESEVAYFTTVKTDGPDGAPADTQFDTLSAKQQEKYLKEKCKHDITPTTDPDAKKDDPDHIEYEYPGSEGKHLYDAIITKAATCKEKGEKALICPDCGLTLKKEEIKNNNAKHDWDIISVAATCRARGYEQQQCKVCGAKGTKVYTTEKPLGHDYSVAVLLEPDHFQAGITLIRCSRCGDGEHGPQSYAFADDLKAAGKIVMVDAEGYVTDDPTKSKGLYFIGFDKEFEEDGLHSGKKITSDAIAVADWAWKKHTDSSKYADYLNATCTLPAYQAKTCSCGYVDVHSVKAVGEPLGHDILMVEHKATCGEWGYIEETCLRCKEYQKLTYTDKPVVAEGAQCKFEWTVTKAPTATEDGEKALVCSVCGAVKDGSQTVVPKDSDEAKDIAIEAATPAIEAAADVISNKAKYTTDSLAAVEEARRMLNQAIASGTAADVSRAAANLQKAVDAAQLKAANPMVAKGKTVKASSKKKMTFKKAKAFTVKKAQGKVTFKKKSGNKKITVSKAGKVTVKKGLKKGKTYKVKVQVKAAGNGNYLAKTKTVTLKVKITK